MGVWNNLESLLKKRQVLIKHCSLLVIAFLSLLLIVFERDGFNFGVIALICWIFAFLDLARIKFGDCEIDFMSHNAALTADERKLFLDNYELVSQFQHKYWQDGAVKKDALGLIYKASNQAELYLPKDISDYLWSITEKATKSFAKHLQLEHIPVGEKRNKIVDEEADLNVTFQKMKPVELYRKYIKVLKDDEK